MHGESARRPPPGLVTPNDSRSMDPSVDDDWRIPTRRTHWSVEELQTLTRQLRKRSARHFEPDGPPEWLGI